MHFIGSASVRSITGGNWFICHIWFVGGAPQVVRRIARIGDGWFPQFQPDGAGRERLEEMRELAWVYGRHRRRGPRLAGRQQQPRRL